MEIRQTKDCFKVVKWVPRPYGKTFKPGTAVQMIQHWGIGIGSRTGFDRNGPVTELTLTLIYQIKGFLEFHCQDVFLVYHPNDRTNEDGLINLALMTLYNKMAQEFEKKKGAVQFQGPLPLISMANLQDFRQKILQFLREEPGR